MPRKEPIEKFMRTAIGSAGTISSIILLIDKAIVLLKEMCVSPEKRTENNRRIRNILAQLQMALNYSEGSSADSLFTLYDYLYEEMLIGDEQSIASAEKLLIQLKETFKELKKKIIMASH
jgi:flagellin-specific chaperone FliS